MPNFSFQFHAFFHELDQQANLAGVLFYPEISAIGKNQMAVRRQLVRQIKHIIGECPPKDLWRRRALAAAPDVRTISLTLEPPRKQIAWRTPAELTFQVIHWQHAESYWLAYVPVLGIEVFSESEAELLELVPRQIEFALKRKGMTESLAPLIGLERLGTLKLLTVQESITLPTPKEIEKAEGEQKPKSTLKEVATRMASLKLLPAYEMGSTLEQLAELLSGSPPRSILLVGPSGVGKTAAVHQLARSKSRFGLADKEFWASSGARFVGGTSGFGMWQERCQSLCEETKRRKNVILHLGSLLELMEVGRGGGCGQGVADFLRLPMDRGEIVVIVECTPEQRVVVECRSPGLLHSLAEVRVLEPSLETGRKILQSACEASTAREQVALKPEALEKLDRLHRRYAAYSVYPGRPLRFLRNLQEDTPANHTLTAQDVIAAFSRETGLPRSLLDETQSLDLGELRSWFSGRVIGQAHAVDLIVELIAAVKAGMTQPDRPIASLLFIGPTGVGKTEMAKTIAEFFFQDRERLTRIDMSEYADPFAVDRLIGGGFQKEGVLTSQVRDQPFGVVLLDEFEKADPSLFDLLLQVLGEGRLTDASGQVADFRNSVVIMTSNLGVESTGKVGFGFRDDSESPLYLRQHFTEEVKKFLRPELYNRIDRIVDFSPLDQNTLRGITGRQLELLQARDGIQYRGVALSVEDGVIEELAALGFDPRYGARPLKRVMERELLKPLAVSINRYAGNQPLTARIDWAEGVRVQVKAIPAEFGTPGNRLGVSAGDTSAQFAKDLAKLRRKVLLLESSVATLEFQNELFRLEQQRDQRIKRKLPPDGELEARWKELHKHLAAMSQCLEDVTHLEDDFLMALYQSREVDLADFRDMFVELESNWQEVLWSAYAATLDRRTRDQVTLAIYAEDTAALIELAAAYRALIEQRGDLVRLMGLISTKGNSDRKLMEGQEWIGKTKLGEPRTRLIGQSFNQDWKAAFKAAPKCVGLGLRISGKLAFPLYHLEQGVHLITAGKHGHRCYVDTARADFSKYQPPYNVDRKGFADDQPKRRTYNKNGNKVEDHWLDTEQFWDGVALEKPLIELVEARLQLDAEELLAE